MSSLIHLIFSFLTHFLKVNFNIVMYISPRQLILELHHWEHSFKTEIHLLRLGVIPLMHCNLHAFAAIFNIVCFIFILLLNPNLKKYLDTVFTAKANLIQSTSNATQEKLTASFQNSFIVAARRLRNIFRTDIPNLKIFFGLKFSFYNYLFMKFKGNSLNNLLSLSLLD